MSKSVLRKVLGINRRIFHVRSDDLPEVAAHFHIIQYDITAAAAPVSGSGPDNVWQAMTDDGRFCLTTCLGTSGFVASQQSLRFPPIGGKRRKEPRSPASAGAQSARAITVSCKPTINVRSSSRMIWHCWLATHLSPRSPNQVLT